MYKLKLTGYSNIVKIGPLIKENKENAKVQLLSNQYFELI